MSRRPIHIVNALLVGALFAGSVWAFDGLPQRIPTHFNFAGEADAYTDVTLLQWLMLPLVGFGTAALLYGCAWLGPRYPGSMNVPDRKRYDALAPEQKAEVIALMQQHLYWHASGLLLLFAVIQWGTYRAAHGASQLPLAVLVFLFAYIVLTLVTAPLLIWQMQRLIVRLSEEAAE